MAKELLMGNQAIALGALKAGVNVVCGYPGTPSTEVLEAIAARNPGGIHVEWSTNEKVALEVGAGAAFSGARALVTMKQVGLNVAADPLMSLPYVGVSGGLVLLVADDPAPMSSQTEQDTRQFAQFAKIPVFDPATPEEACAMIPEAFELSERYRTPVIVRPSTRICHGSAAFETDIPYQPHPVSGFERSPHWIVLPRRAYEGHKEIIERLPIIEQEFCDHPLNSIEHIELPGIAKSASNSDQQATGALSAGQAASRRLGIVASGISYAYLRDALSMLIDQSQKQVDGFSAETELRLLRVATPFPFPDQRAVEFLDSLDEVLVFEELEPVVERELQRVCGAFHLPVTIKGKLTKDTTVAGENTVNSLLQQVNDFLSTTNLAQVQAETPPTDLATPELPARPPMFCAGCPHRGSFAATKRALKGRPAIFSGDIGCYTLANAQPLDMIDTCICMGGGFTVPQGMAWAQPDVLHLGFLGDSTFFASGLTGVVNAVYNRANLVLVVLDNSTTAMTGAQPHAGTGRRMSGNDGYNAAVKADMERDALNALRIPDILHAMGIEHVDVVDPLDFDASVEAIRRAVAIVDAGKGVSAVVFRSPCIAVSPPQPIPWVDPEACTLCRICINTLGCPAISIAPTEKTIQIDTGLCYGCDLCVQVCPFKAINRTGDSK
ncbi:MAG: 4Fe-4S binding protein [Coriobacteriaceae bacterium]|nr:4Fe-4S binding protein [Coriobacteriaceae bacterium]